jgi:hypothetical protein
MMSGEAIVGIRAHEKKFTAVKHVSVDSAPDLGLRISALVPRGRIFIGLPEKGPIPNVLVWRGWEERP